MLGRTRNGPRVSGPQVPGGAGGGAGRRQAAPLSAAGTGARTGRAVCGRPSLAAGRGPLCCKPDLQACRPPELTAGHTSPEEHARHRRIRSPNARWCAGEPRPVALKGAAPARALRRPRPPAAQGHPSSALPCSGDCKCERGLQIAEGKVQGMGCGAPVPKPAATQRCAPTAGAGRGRRRQPAPPSRVEGDAAAALQESRRRSSSAAVF